MGVCLLVSQVDTFPFLKYKIPLIYKNHNGAILVIQNKGFGYIFDWQKSAATTAFK